MRLKWLILLVLAPLGCQPTVQQPATEAPPPAATAKPRPTTQSLTGTVVDVADGDTLTVRTDGTEHRIRLHGIDCPEGGQPFGDEAKRFTMRVAMGKEVRVAVLDRDRYGRLVGLVTLPDGSVLNHELAQAGLAWHYARYAPDDQKLAKLQAEAKAARRGLWADENPIPPWDWRHRDRPQPPAPAEVVANGVTIAAVLPNPKGPDEGNEKVLIANATDQPVELQGWRLQDAAGNTFLLAGTVPAKGTLEITLKPPTMPLNNDGDEVSLIDGEDVARSRLRYLEGDVRSGRWIESGR